MRIAPSLLLSFVLLPLPACGGGGTESGGEGGGITLSAPSSEVVEGFTLAVTASSSDPKNATLVWTSNDLGVASVDQDGQVQGCAAGLVTIAARSPATGARGTIEINVLPDADFNTLLPVDASNLAPTIERTSTVERCEVILRHTGIAATVVKRRWRRYHRLRLPMTGVLGDVGQPELPFYTLYFAIPVDPQTHARATWSVAVERESPLTYPGIRPWPHQPPTWMDGESAEKDAPPAFVVDEASYEAQSARPAVSYGAEVAEIGNLPILEVRVAPLRYMPAARLLELFETTRVVVTFEGTGPLVMPRPLGDYKGIQERGADELLADYVQNRDLLTPVTEIDLTVPLPPVDEIGVMDTPFDLLIVTRASLQVPARRLARWRQDHGLRVWLAVLDETLYPSADAIREAIRTLHDASRVELADGHYVHAMRALLIFGDVEHIPTFMGHRQRNRGLPTADDTDNVLVCGTDLPYSTLRGDDLEPEFACGRISVDDDGQGTAVVLKIEDYDSHPAGQHPYHTAIYGYFEDSPEFLGTRDGAIEFSDGSVLVSGTGTAFGATLEGDLIRPNRGEAFDEGAWPVRVNNVVGLSDLSLWQPWPTDSEACLDGYQRAREDGQENKGFVLGAERIRAFMRSQGVDVRWGYTRTEGLREAPAPERDFEGNDLHADLVGYGWDVNSFDIADDWDDGLDGIVLHSGHGGPTQWNDPEFSKTRIPAPASSAGPWLPIVFSINCSNGYFDSETDLVWVWNDDTDSPVLTTNTPAAGHWPQFEVSFCEHLLRKSGGGGVAAVGASRGTTSGYNDRLIDGLYSYMYDTYDHPVLLPGTTTRPRALAYLGDIVTSAKRVMYGWVASAHGAGKPPSAEYCLQTYHLFGDPMLRVRPPRQAVDD